jgi:LmbE family N-acetylglucosaminyl deacetylase
MMTERVLVVTAHPDDPEFHFGATVAQLVDHGSQVNYLIVTDGDQGICPDPMSPHGQVGLVRCAEQRRAAAFLGVQDVTFLGWRDGSVVADLSLRKAIVAEVRRRRPSLVITHYPYRVLGIPLEASHSDHIGVGEAVLAAVYPDSGNARAFPELRAAGLGPHLVREVWLPGYEHPDHYVDATPYLRQKIDAIGCHRSQLTDGSVPEWIYGWMREVGRAYGYEYSESYRRISVY